MMEELVHCSYFVTSYHFTINSRRLADERCDFPFQLEKLIAVPHKNNLTIIPEKILCTFPSYT